MILQIDNCEQLATKNTILQNSANLFLLGLKCQIMFQLGLYTWKRNLILLRLPLFATIFEKSHEKSHWKIFKHLGLYEILLETYFKHWIPVLGTPKGCPALEKFWFFYLDPPSEHSNSHAIFQSKVAAKTRIFKILFHNISTQIWVYTNLWSPTNKCLWLWQCQNWTPGNLAKSQALYKHGLDTWKFSKCLIL